MAAADPLLHPPPPPPNFPANGPGPVPSPSVLQSSEPDPDLLTMGGSVSVLQLAAILGLAAAVVAMLLVTQTKHRVSWPGWLVPAAAGIPMVAVTILAIATEGPTAFWSLYTGSLWGIQMWYDRLMSVTAAFFLLQNRARAAGLKSEVWVLLVIFTGSMGLLVMLAQTVYLEREQAGYLAREQAG